MSPVCRHRIMASWLTAAGLSISMVACASPAMAPDSKLTSKTQTPEKHTMNQDPQASRAAPADVPPVEIKGVRYQQDMHSYDHGGDQPGGYLCAVDIQTGQRLWMLKVYEVQDHSASGVDTIGLHFKTMKRVSGHDQLEIENESGSRFLVDVVKRTSTPISKPRANPLPPISIPQ
jgi:hypothetical protein